eukprot:TRINITY_DN94935_c0_g1_i1.p1 TRINITY_DN94935_c0_g1~~TRINITY_DN94935_c0_g1_i1.p1  ORF type:complete len:433 (-),score=46.86 TRINITY_DN94935_c0_g1_i1:25-1323(-)
MAFLLALAALPLALSAPVTPFSRLRTAAHFQSNRTARHLDATAYPSETHKGVTNGTLNTWITSPAEAWTSGFFPGILWKIAADEGMTVNSTWLQQALRWTEGIRSQQYDTQHHDVGFKVFGSFGQALQLAAGTSVEGLLAERKYVNVVITAAHSLATRFSPAVGCTQSWNVGHHCRAHPAYTTEFPVIIDNMMNLELLFWAARNTSNETLYRIAESHANKTAENHVRPDGSTFHVVDYNPDTGAVARRCTAQGWGDNSTWSRGQGWCIYGFTMAYRYTRLPVHLETARKCADFFLAKVMVQGVPLDYVPLWDFDFTGKQTEHFRDASAGSIAASALLELASFVAGALARVYKAAATNILESLGTSYLGNSADTEGIIIHSTRASPRWSPESFDVSLVYAGYYALEAIGRYAEGSGSSFKQISSTPDSDSYII